MQQKLSRENIADLAQHAVSRFRSLINTKRDILTRHQQDLLKLSKKIEELWQRKKQLVECDCREWAANFATELAWQIRLLSGGAEDDLTSVGSPVSVLPATADDAKPLPESAMATCIDAARILVKYDVTGDVVQNIASNDIVPLLTNFFMIGVLQRKTREMCARTLLDISGSSPALMRVFLNASLSFLCVLAVDRGVLDSASSELPITTTTTGTAAATHTSLSKQDNHSRDDRDDEEEEKTRTPARSSHVTSATVQVRPTTSLQLYLIYLLVTAMHRVEMVQITLNWTRHVERYSTNDLLMVLYLCHHTATRGRTLPHSRMTHNDSKGGNGPTQPSDRNSYVTSDGDCNNVGSNMGQHHTGTSHTTITTITATNKNGSDNNDNANASYTHRSKTNLKSKICTNDNKDTSIGAAPANAGALLSSSLPLGASPQAVTIHSNINTDTNNSPTAHSSLASPATPAAATNAAAGAMPVQRRSNDVSYASAAAELTSTSEPAGQRVNDGLHSAACVLQLALLGALLRGDAGHKELLIHHYAHEFLTIWSVAATRLSSMPSVIFIPVPVSTKELIISLQPMNVWQSEMLEALIEICTDGSFVRSRHILECDGKRAAAATSLPQGVPSRPGGLMTSFYSPGATAALSMTACPSSYANPTATTSSHTAATATTGPSGMAEGIFSPTVGSSPEFGSMMTDGNTAATTVTGNNNNNTYNSTMDNTNASSNYNNHHYPHTGTMVMGHGVPAFEPLPAHWDTLLTGGGQLVWRLAQSLSACVLIPATIDLLKGCLLLLDTHTTMGGALYRSLIATLMLLSVSTPHNARVLGEGAFAECLMALMTSHQRSVFAQACSLRLTTHTAVCDGEMSSPARMREGGGGGGGTRDHHTRHTGDARDAATRDDAIDPPSRDTDLASNNSNHSKSSTVKDTHRNTNNHAAANGDPNSTNEDDEDAVVEMSSSETFLTRASSSIDTPTHTVTLTLCPASHLSTSNTQLTMALFSLLCSTHVSSRLVPQVMDAVDRMSRPHGSHQIDTTIVESFLHVIDTMHYPMSTIYFPGCSNVVCRTSRFSGRWTGYSFLAWVRPICVWATGSPLYSIQDPSGSALTWGMTANGKTCFLVLCVYACSGECVASYTVPNTFLLADAWSHIAILHSYSGVDVYVNGRRRDFAAAVSFPREPTRRQRLEISFGVGSVFGGGGGGGGGKTGGGDAAHRRVSPATTPTATASVVASGSSDANSVGRSERSDHSAHTSHNNIAAAAHHFATMANIAHATTGMSNTTPVDATTAAAAAAATSTTIRSSSSRGMQNTMYSSCNNHGSTSHATTMRGLSSSLSFFGYVTHMDLLDGMITEKDVMRIAAAGPHCRGACTYNLTTMLSIRANESAQTTDSALPLVVSGSFLSHNESVSVHGVLTFTPVNVSAVFAQEKVAEWALRTMREHHHSPHFTQVAKLCMTFLMTAMRLTHGTAELETVLSDGLMDRLQAEILSWEEAFLEFSALALTAVTPRGAGKVLRQHASTQVMLNTLLAMLRAGRLGAMVLTCILRELSDCLLVPENVSLFRAVPGRFEEVLYISLTLPRECTHSVVFLIEKLCKSPAELEQTLRFLLLPQDGVSAEAAKEGIMRMLYDVARANRELCDLIAAAGKGNGVIFLMAMVNGMNHSSETIRVFALRLISLLLHVNKKLRGSFVKSHSFMLLAKAITDPLSSVPITLPTLDCLFRMAFDSFGPTEKSSETAIASRLGLLTKTKNRVMSSGKLFDAVPVTGSSGMDGEGTTAGSKRAMWGGNEAMHANNSTAHNSTNNSSANVNHSSIGPIHTTTTAAIATSSSGSNNNNNGGGCAYANRATLQGYFPGLNLRLLSHTRREYSFELGLDYNGGEDVLRAEDDYDRHAELPPQLVVPHAFQTALSVLGCLVLSTFASASHRGGAGGGSGILATAALAAIAPSLPLDDPATATRATSRLRCVGSPTAHPGVVAPSARDEATATRSGARETTGEDGHSPMLTQDELELSLSGREAESPDSNTATTAETPPSMTRLPGGSSNTGKSNRNNDDDKINGARRDNNPTGHCHENSNCSTGGDDTRHGGGAITESNTHNNRCRCQTDNNNNINNSSNKNNNDPDNDSSSPANKNNKSISKSNSNSNSTGCAQLSGGSRASHPNEAKLKCVRRWVDADSTPHTTIPSASRTSSCAATGGGGAGAVGAAGLSGGELESREGTDGTSETGVSVSMNGAVQDGTGSYYSYGSRKAGSGAAENVVRSVLRYLEKVLDVSSNAEALLPFAWLDWLWSAMAPVMVSQHTPPPSAPTVHGGGSSSTTTTTTNTAATATTTTTTTMATNATGGGLPRRKFVIAARAATRTIIRKMIIFDMRRNSKAKTVLRLRARSFSPVLVRLILEEVARYFAKGSHWQPADQMEAHHLIKNMDILFANVEGLLQPFPPTLGIEIVAAINFFALSNTTLVRMRMKNHSTLFQTRDQLAFYNVVSIPRYARMTYKLLEQLIDANAYHLDTMTVLLDRLVTAVGAMELDEVEVQIRLIRHLVLTDEGQQDELYRVLGQPGVVLANYLCRGPDEMMAPGTSRATGNSSIIVDNHSTSVSGLPFALGAPPVAAHAAQAGLVAARVPRETMGGLLAGRFQGSGHVCNPRERRGSAASTTTRTRTSTPPPPPSNDATTTTDDGREAHMAFSAASAPTIAPPAESYTSARCGASAQHGSETGELTMNHRCPHYPSSPITAIVGWCQAHVAICDAIHHAAQRIIRGRLATMRGIGERGERDRAYLARAARAETERADHKEAKLEAEFKRLMAEVQAQIGGHV